MFPSEILNVDDPVLMYDRFMEEIDLKKYLRYIPTRGAGRPRYNPGVCQEFCVNRFNKQHRIAA